jgi:hypothetical protein
MNRSISDIGTFGSRPRAAEDDRGADPSRRFGEQTVLTECPPTSLADPNRPSGETDERSVDP